MIKEALSHQQVKTVFQVVPQHSCSVWSTHMAVNQLKYRLLLMANRVASHVKLASDQRLAAWIAGMP